MTVVVGVDGSPPFLSALRDAVSKELCDQAEQADLRVSEELAADQSKGEAPR